MSDIEKLKSLPVQDLVKELKRREGKPKTSKKASVASTDDWDGLSGIETRVIVDAARSMQKVIYGVDNRVDIFQLPAGAERDDADSVVALFNASDITDNGDGTSTLSTEKFGTAQNLCAGERFREQPIGAFCSGFLVGPDVIATAGHCVNAGNVTTVRFVFGFRMRNTTTAETTIDNSEIYSGASLIGRKLTTSGTDWAVVRLDRPVTNHRVVSIRRSGKVADTQSLHVIGHPVGLPAKFADGAEVRDNSKSAIFVANLDTYGGNSGSPVFNSDTHEVEGILVRGETDFVSQGSCRVSLVCPSTGCSGESCTRTTEFSTLV